MKEYIATSWNDLLSLVKEAKSELKDPSQVWFRGQTNAAYNLIPSLLRHQNGFEREQFLFKSFLKLSLKVFPRKRTDWETLFDMQHYGVPTRLFDWSENLGIATFFAINYRGWSNEEYDAAVYILDPISLNSYSGLKEIPFVPEDPDFDYKKIYWQKKPFAPKYPIAMEPIFQNDRILAQKGMFTIHGDDDTPIQDLCPNAVKKIVITKRAIPEAQEFLDIANINARSVFPDMFGVADYIRKTSGLE